MVIHETSWTVEITTGPERTLLLCVVTKGLEADVDQVASITDEQARWLAHDLTAEEAGCCEPPPGIQHRRGVITNEWIIVDDGEKWLLSAGLNHEDREPLAVALLSQIGQAQNLRAIEAEGVRAGLRAGGSE